MEILIVQTAFLGDLLLSIPLIRNVKASFPQARVTLVCRSGLRSLFESFALVDEVFEVSKGEASSYKKVQSQLKKTSWEMIFCPHESFRTAMFVAPLKAKNKIGYKKWWNSYFYNRRIERDWSDPDAIRQMALLGVVHASFKNQLDDLRKLPGIRNPIEKNSAVDFRNIELPSWASMSIESSETEIDFPFLTGRDVYIFPGSVWPTKQWTEDGYAETAQKLVNQNYQVHWMGSKDEAALCARLQKRVPKSLSHAGQLSLSQCFKALKKGKLLICNDSGSMHMGAAAGLKSIAIFGPTTLALGYRPWQQQATVVQIDLNCRPCGKHGHKKCPLGHHNCMKMISPDLVLIQTKRFL